MNIYLLQRVTLKFVQLATNEMAQTQSQWAKMQNITMRHCERSLLSRF